MFVTSFWKGVRLVTKCDKRKVGVNFMPKRWTSFTDDPYGVE